jgi:hypothetical protein
LAAKKRKATDSLENLRKQLGEANPKSSTPTDKSLARAPKEKVVRISVDMPRSQHKYLRDFAYDAETDGMSVVRGLLELLKEDSELAERLHRRLASS